MQNDKVQSIKNASFSGKIGISRKDITPPEGIYSRNWAISPHNTSVGVHRPLTLTCIVFQSDIDDQLFVMFAADLGWWKSKKDEELIRNYIIETLDLSVDSVMVCLSHTHAGPYVWSENRNLPGGEHIEGYLSFLKISAAEIAKEAKAKVAPAVLSWNYGKCGLAANRDFFDPKAGRYVVGLNPSSKADDTLLVGRITNIQGKVIGTLVNYACHPTSLGWVSRLISPDFVGAMREIIEVETKAPCLFLQGASGELAPKEQYADDPALTDKLGRELGFAALSVIESMFDPAKQLSYLGLLESGASLGIWKQTFFGPSTVMKSEKFEVSLQLKPLPSLSEIDELIAGCTNAVEKERLTRKRGVRLLYGSDSEVSLQVWVWRLGDSIFVGQPYEAYSDFQIAIRDKFPLNTVAVMNIVNGPGGYLPPAALYDKDMYSARLTPFDKGSLELLIEKSIEVIYKILR